MPATGPAPDGPDRDRRQIARYLTLAEAAGVLGFSTKTVRRLTRLPRDPLPCYTVAAAGKRGHLRFRDREIVLWMRRRKGPPTDA